MVVLAQFYNRLLNHNCLYHIVERQVFVYRVVVLCRFHVKVRKKEGIGLSRLNVYKSALGHLDARLTKIS